MPLYEFACKKCRCVSTEIFKHSLVPSSISCFQCGHSATRKISLIASTPAKWGDSHGYYDHGLGTYVANEQSRQAEMKRQGLVEARDFGTHYIDDKLDQEVDEARAHQADVDKIDKLKADGFETGHAIAEVFNQERLLGE
jgi:putative FmdB family regulatory protein